MEDVATGQGLGIFGIDGFEIDRTFWTIIWLGCWLRRKRVAELGKVFVDLCRGGLNGFDTGVDVYQDGESSFGVGLSEPLIVLVRGRIQESIGHSEAAICFPAKSMVPEPCKIQKSVRPCSQDVATTRFTQVNML